MHETQIRPTPSYSFFNCFRKLKGWYKYCQDESLQPIDSMQRYCLVIFLRKWNACWLIKKLSWFVSVAQEFIFINSFTLSCVYKISSCAFHRMKWIGVSLKAWKLKNLKCFNNQMLAVPEKKIKSFLFFFIFIFSLLTAVYSNKSSVPLFLIFFNIY